MKRGAARYSAYRIAYFEIPEVAEGQVLIDTGWLLERDWTFMVIGSGGEPQTCGGPRIARLCPVCVSDFDRPAGLDHQGAHGKDAPLYDDATTEETP